MTENNDPWSSFEAEVTHRRVRQCGMMAYLDSLDEGPRKMVQVAGLNSEVPVTSLHKSLVARGFTKSHEVVRRHFTGNCSCYRGMS